MRRLIAAVLAVFILAVLVACGASGPEPVSEPAQEETDTVPAPEDDVPEPVPDEPPPGVFRIQWLC